MGMEIAALSSRAVKDPYAVNKEKYQGQEYEPALGLNMHEFEARHYDPQLGRWVVPDPANQYASPYMAMGNNGVIMYDPDGQFAVVPILIGAAIGAFTGGIQADMQGKSFWSGAWKGALIGAVGGTLGQFGGGTFLSQVAWGAGEGVVTGGLGAALNGGNVWQGMLKGAGWGAAFASVTSGIESIKNAKEGYGLGTNDGRLKKMIGEYHDAIDLENQQIVAERAIKFVDKRYGLGKYNTYYDPELALKGVDGEADIVFQNIAIGPSAFSSASQLKATMVHENGHVFFEEFRNQLGYPFADPHLNWDGPTGYAQEIYNAGRMHIYRHSLKSNPLWSIWDQYKGSKWKYLLPLRFNPAPVFKPF
jgi:RHS repeat-associated protein